MNGIWTMRADSLETALVWVYNRLVPSLLALAALVGLWFLGQNAERPVYDLLLRWSARPASRSPVTLVLMDNESIVRLSHKFGPLPWPRAKYLEIFRAVQARNPSLMVLDSHFVNLNQQEDTRFFEALAGFPGLISGVVLPETLSGQDNMNTSLPAYYRLNLGVVSVQEDEDGVIRRLKPFYHLNTDPLHAGVFPAISINAAYEYLQRQKPGQGWNLDFIPAYQGSLLALKPDDLHAGLSSRQLKLDEHGAFRLRWYRILNPGKSEYARSHPAIPMWRFFDDRETAPDLRGQIALIGSSATFYRDNHRSPMALHHAGPDIHATAIDNLLRSESIQPISPWINMILLYALCFATFQIRMQIRHFGKTLLYTLGTMIIYFWLAFWLLAEHSIWLDVTTPELFIVAAFLAGSTFRIFFKEKQLAAMEKNLSQLVDPEVFREIRRLSHVLKPGGEKLEITSMFVDIRNFTTLAERLQPHEVTDLLNEFYGDIVNIVFSNQGTIDKFMGDGILIIFGAPLPNELHRVLALRAALEILVATQKLSVHWKDSKGINTDIGISLNSGVAFVGFLGPADKLEYTGVGDTVNICVRLQEHTKQFKTRLIMSEDTIQGITEELTKRLPPDSLVALGEVTVRGRESSLNVFTFRQAFLDYESG